MSRGASLTLGAIALVAALVAYKLGELGGAASARDAVTTSSSHGVLALGTAYRQALARATARQGLADQARRHWRDSARTLERWAATWDSLVAADAERRASESDSARIPDWVEAARRWRTVAEARDAESKQCTLAIMACDARATLAEARVDTLTKQLGAQVLVGSCKVNLLVTRVGCPSRTTVFLVGVGMGGAGAVVLSH